MIPAPALKLAPVGFSPFPFSLAKMVDHAFECVWLCTLARSCQNRCFRLPKEIKFAVKLLLRVPIVRAGCRLLSLLVLVIMQIRLVFVLNEAEPLSLLDFSSDHRGMG